MRDTLLWSVEEAAHQLGEISIRTIQRLIDRGELPLVKVGRRVMIPVSAIREWIDQQAQSAHNQQGAGPGVRSKEKSACHTDAKIVPFGGYRTPTQMGKELDALLAPRTEKKLTR
ncbi:MAG: helix-turn-helix domain-containing protein [Nitrososphaera sp.]